MTIFSSLWSRLHVLSLHREIRATTEAVGSVAVPFVQPGHAKLATNALVVE